MVMVAVDVGGTFTDVVLFDPGTSEIRAGKVASTAADLTEGFVNGVDRLGVTFNQASRVLHGTTTATNAAIERKGARTGGVFTKGFRDVLAIGTGQRFTGGLFDPAFRRAQPLIQRSLCFEVRERSDHRGQELRPVETADVEAVAEALVAAGVEAVAVCFFHSYARPEHEEAVERFLQARLPGVFICRSGDVLPQIREYERFTTAAFNAYLGPVMQRYLSRLGERLREQGYAHDVLLMTSNGGVTSASYAARYPVTTVLSGPAGGVSAGLHLGRTLEIGNLITCDMGGTSTDVCLIKNGRPTLAEQRLVSGLPLRMPQLDVNTIGAGGGSIARVEPEGSFRVGPHSAGAMPGPACYDRGGAQATVTDANLVLGRLGLTNRLAGFLQLRPDLAHKAVESIAVKLGLPDVASAAAGILSIAVANMAGAIREISIERGEDPRPFTLVAFGGAGPMHGCEVAEEVGMSRVIVPLFPGNFSALGLLISDLRHEFVRSSLAFLDEADLTAVGRLLADMGSNGRAILAEEGAAAQDIEIRHLVELRYKGQAYQLAVEVDPQAIARDHLAERFRRLYLDTWSHEPEGTAVQIVNLRVSAVGRAPQLGLRAPNPATGSIGHAVKETRPIYFAGDFRSTPVYDRFRLPLGQTLAGPAIVDEEGATTVVPPGWKAHVHPSGHLFIERH